MTTAIRPPSWMAFVRARMSVLVAVLLLATAIAAVTAALTAPVVVLPDRGAPSWNVLLERLDESLETDTHSYKPTTNGPYPHAKARSRLFRDDKKEDDDTTKQQENDNGTQQQQPRVVLYRDSAAWCPYCQRVWIYLEERKIPYQVEFVPLDAYGDKPVSFTRLVETGQVPAILLDGQQVVTESLEILRVLDDDQANNLTDEPSLLPNDNTIWKYYLDLEQQLQSVWFSLIFYPVKGDALVQAQHNLWSVLNQFNNEFAKNNNGKDDDDSKVTSPWILGGSRPSVVDILFMTTLERIQASCWYYHGMDIFNVPTDNNNNQRRNHLEAFIHAWQTRPSYMATRCDIYTHVMAMPSQNGPGYFTAQADTRARAICGLDGAWTLPLQSQPWDPQFLLARSMGQDGRALEQAARHEAAWCLASNAEAVVRFACRGAGEPGRPSFHAELADPYAEPNEDYVQAVDVCLRHVAAALLDDGIDHNREVAIQQDLAGQAGDGVLRPNWDAYEDDNGRIYYWNEETGDTVWTPPTQQLDTCLAYLRDRIGVPRDMSLPAAMQLRAHLNWLIDIMQ